MTPVDVHQLKSFCSFCETLFQEKKNFNTEEVDHFIWVVSDLLDAINASPGNLPNEEKKEKFDKVFKQISSLFKTVDQRPVEISVLTVETQLNEDKVNSIVSSLKEDFEFELTNTISGIGEIRGKVPSINVEKIRNMKDVLKVIEHN